MYKRSVGEKKLNREQEKGYSIPSWNNESTKFIPNA
jgi:hypothetical protein